MASINLQSKDGAGDDGSRSPIRSRGVSSPWSKIVRGDSGELRLPAVSVAALAASSSSPSIQEQIVNPSSDSRPPKTVPESDNSPDDSGTDCQSEGSGNGSGGGNNAVKKPVWSKPSNGVVEAVSPVMGAVSWPALGESTKPSPKSSSSESLPALSDGILLPALQVTGNLPSSHKLTTANQANPTSTPNHVAPSAQRSMKRGGGNSGTYTSSNGGFSQRSQAIHDPKVESPRNTTGKPATVTTTDSYTKDQRGGFGSQPNSGTNDNHHQRNSYRRGNGGQHPRGNQEWNQHRSYNNNRDTNSNMQPQRGGFRRGYVRPSVHASTPLIRPYMTAPIHPFGNNVMYPDMAPAMFYVQGPTPPIQPPMYFPVQDPDLHEKIKDQIDYYFSEENLVKDTYLRGFMDGQGWVSVNLIATFKKVSRLTNNVVLILDVMRTSTAVEVQGDKMRPRKEWMKWVLPSALTQDSLASQLQGIGLDDMATNGQVHVESFPGQQGGYERATVA